MRKRLPKILVVDDEQNIRKLVQINLTAREYRVAVAPNGEEGLKLAHLEHPDLILLDLMMLGMSGWDVLMVLKSNQKLRKVPVIIMTAAVPEGEEYKIRSMRVAGYLVKPFGVDELLRQVKQVLGE